MDSTLSERKSEKIEALADDIEASVEIGHDTENQLSNNLIAITLAFVALLAASVSTSDVLTTIDFGQELLMMLSIAIFSVSIFVGLLNYYLNMIHHQKIVRINRSKARRAEKIDSKTELNALRPASLTEHAGHATRRNNILIGLQIMLLMVGLTLCVVFIGTMLFHTARYGGQS